MREEGRILARKRKGIYAEEEYDDEEYEEDYDNDNEHHHKDKNHNVSFKTRRGKRVSFRAKKKDNPTDSYEYPF